MDLDSFPKYNEFKFAKVFKKNILLNWKKSTTVWSPANIGHHGFMRKMKMNVVSMALNPCLQF